MIIKKLKEKIKESKGITLIELVVGLAVFMIIIGIAVSIFISIIQHQRGLLAEQELTNQASYSVEYISRTIKGALKDETGNCITAGDIYTLTNYDDTSYFYGGIKFLTENNVCQEFFIDSGIVKEVKDGALPQEILADKFKVEYLRFIINGNKFLDIASGGDLVQPRVTIALSIEKPPLLAMKADFNPFKINYAKAESQNISNKHLALALPPLVTGVSCVNNMCIFDPFGSDVCNLGSSCGGIIPTTGFSCVNSVCSANIAGTDICTPGVACGPPPPPTGYSCVNSMCILDFFGTDNCTAGLACGSSIPTGYSCINNTCSMDPIGTDSCTIGLACGPPTGSTCLTGMCTADYSGVQECLPIGGVCDAIWVPPVSISDAVTIQTTVSQINLNIE